MWCVNEISDAAFMEATITLDISQFGQGLPKGFDGKQKKGFSFYELKEYKRRGIR